MPSGTKPQSVSIASFDGAAGAELGRNLAAHVEWKGLPALHIDLGRLYRALAAFACEQVREQMVAAGVPLYSAQDKTIKVAAKVVNAGEMRRLLSHHPLRLDGSDVYLGGKPVELEDWPGGQLVKVIRQWSRDDKLRRLVNQAVAGQQRAFRGWSVLSGVGKADRLVTGHQVVIARTPAAVTITVQSSGQPAVQIPIAT